MLQTATPNLSKGHNFVSRAKREFSLQMILLSHWFHTLELTIYTVVLRRKLHNKSPDLYCSANNIQVNRSKRIRQLVLLGETGNACRHFLLNLTEKTTSKS
jgi:tRNA(Met) C34 N-acetyltransferase TmcA